MNEIQKPNENAGMQISDQQALMEREINSVDGGGFIKDLRIKSKSSDIPGATGDWIFGGANNVAKVGEPLEVHIGVWRYQGWRFANKTLEIKSFNLTANSKFENGNWTLGDPEQRIGTLYTPNYFTVMLGGMLGDAKKLAEFSQRYGPAVDKYRKDAKPDNGLSLRNLVGTAHLLYIPAVSDWAIYFISGQAKTQTTVKDDLRRFQGSVGYLVSKEGAGKYKPMVPEFRSKPGQTAKFPADFDQVFEKFLYETVDVIDDPNARPR